jgi:hypothetical protein
MPECTLRHAIVLRHDGLGLPALVRLWRILETSSVNQAVRLVFLCGFTAEVGPLAGRPYRINCARFI